MSCFGGVVHSRVREAGGEQRGGDGRGNERKKEGKRRIDDRDRRAQNITLPVVDAECGTASTCQVLSLQL